MERQQSWKMLNAGKHGWKSKRSRKAETKAASKGGIHGRLEKAKVEIKAKEAEKVPKNKSKDLATAL